MVIWIIKTSTRRLLLASGMTITADYIRGPFLIDITRGLWMTTLIQHWKEIPLHQKQNRKRSLIHNNCTEKKVILLIFLTGLKRVLVI